MGNNWPKVKLGAVLRLDLDRVPVDPATSYPMVGGVLSFGRGLFDREPIENGNTSYKASYRLKAAHVVMSQLFGWEGALALSSEEFASKFLSPQFPTFLCDPTRLDREFLGWLMRRPAFWDDLGSRASGMGDRRRTLNPEALFACDVPLPPLVEQRRIVARIEELAAKIAQARELQNRRARRLRHLLLHNSTPLMNCWSNSMALHDWRISSPKQVTGRQRSVHSREMKVRFRYCGYQTWHLSESNSAT